MLKFDEFEFVETTDKIEVIKEGYQPPIHDFSIEFNSIDITDSILNSKQAFLVISYDIKKAHVQSSKYLESIYQECMKKNIPFVALSASSDSLKEDFRDKNNIMMYQDLW